MTEAFPLHWPEGWPRTTYRDSSSPFRGVSFSRALNDLLDTVRLLGGRHIVVSTNMALRRDGLPYANTARIDDPGVAVYFQLKDRPVVMARDKFKDIAANLRSLAMAIDGMRMTQRHGGGVMLDRMFQGFAALPDPNRKKTWREVLGVDLTASPEDVRTAYRNAAMQHHPDRGGSQDAMAAINEAWEQAQQEGAA